MNDLFEHDRRSRKGGGKVPSSPPSGRKGKGEGSEPSQGGGKVPDPSKHFPLPHPTPDTFKGRGIEKETGLRERLSAVYRDLELANDLVERVKPSADFHSDRFWEADRALRDAIVYREAESGRWNLFALYDDRMIAGHAWNPHRRRLNEAMSWRKNLMDEAKAINKELGT